MIAKWMSGISTAALALVLVSPQAMAQLTGQVTSAEEGAMEGVVVSAKKADSNITTSVITSAQGRFTIPADRLDAGKYTISTRAVGYDLDGPKEVTIAMPGRDCDRRLSTTRPEKVMRSPAKTGFSHLSSSKPGEGPKRKPRPARARAAKYSTCRRISTAQVCQPLAIRRP